MQNNSGGYFITDEENGIGEFIIVEARDKDMAIALFECIGKKYKGDFYSYCQCCGERWDTWLTEDYDAKDEPMIYDKPVAEFVGGYMRKTAYVHYLDGTIKTYTTSTK